MKILIWFLCVLVASMIETSIEMKGVLLGAIPTLLIWSIPIAAARYFCRMWDEHKALVSAAEKKYGKQKKWYEKVFFPKGPSVVPDGTVCVVQRKDGVKIAKQSDGSEIIIERPRTLRKHRT